MKSKIDTTELLSLLPSNLKDSDLLSLEAKKVLSALLYWYENTEARNTGRVFVSNNELCKIAGVSKTTIQNVAAFEFNKYALVRKIAGKPKASRNDIGQATEWIINWSRLTQPLKELSFEERFSDRLKPSENPMSTPIQYNTIQNNSKQEKLSNEKINKSNERHFTASQSSEMQDNLIEDIPNNDKSKANMSISTPVDTIDKNEEKTPSSINYFIDIKEDLRQCKSLEELNEVWRKHENGKPSYLTEEDINDLQEVYGEELERIKNQKTEDEDDFQLPF